MWRIGQKQARIRTQQGRQSCVRGRLQAQGVAGAQEGWILAGSSASWEVPEEQANRREPSSGFILLLSVWAVSL